MAELKILKSWDGEEDKALDTCATCPKLCRWSCPVAEAEARETSTPWNLMVMSGFLKKGLSSVESVSSAPFHCTHCGACTEYCKHDNDVPRWLTLSRARVLAGHGAPESAIEVRGHFGTAGNPYGTDLKDSLQTAVAKVRGEDGPRPSGAIVYHPGCSTIHQMPEAVTGFLRAAALNGITGVAVNEASSSCCGLPLLWAGDLEGFVAQAKRHAARLESADTVIAHEPSCMHAMVARYPEFGISLKADVVHVSQFLASRLGQASHAGPSESSVAYIDSCSLGRLLDTTDAPRELIERATGEAPTELAQLSGHPMDCCGAAGLLPQTAPGTARAMGEARIAAFKATGAERLVTFSPRCGAHLLRIDPTIDLLDGSMLWAKVEDQ